VVKQKEGEADGDGEEHSQTDEEDMGMSYKELGDYGRLRKISRYVGLSAQETLSQLRWPAAPVEVLF
jgi:NAD+ synthase (glutamine-hydrolysing)